MKYPESQAIKPVLDRLAEFADLKAEYGADMEKIQLLLDDARQKLEDSLEKLKNLEESAWLKDKEPDDYARILQLCPAGSHDLWQTFDEKKYADRLAGAFLGRAAGCTLGAPVEGWSTEDMTRWAKYQGIDFPSTDYWTLTKNPGVTRYTLSTFNEYMRDNLTAIPVDDDIAYTILGLLIAEQYGLDFSTADVGKAWLKYVPLAYTAEAAALRNLKNNIPAEQAADVDNPFCQWIGADIRSDPWGYLAPGRPREAARMAYQDAYLSHRRNGIYGEMYFSAVIAAAFAVTNTVEALEIGLKEIPADCSLAHDIQWALEKGPGIKDYLEAKEAVDKRFDGMSKVHTNNNACLTIFGLMLGQDDFTKIIGNTVAMGYDNDCTAATAGSIAGAIMGIKGIPAYWYERFNNRVLTYLTGVPELAIDDVIQRFTDLSGRNF